MEYYHRRLPHFHQIGTPLFITWHLHGSLPTNRYPPPEINSPGRAFVWMDRYLDQARIGPVHLRRAEIAQLVVDALHYGSTTLHYYELHSYVIMANHVHVLLTPLVAVPQLLGSIKGFTARTANKLLNQAGQPFWQRESYDRLVRDPAEFEKIRRYIENNPVKAGLVSSPELYPWSSAAHP